MKKSSYRLIKRVIDIVGAGVGLVLLSPLMALVALAIRVTMGKPVIFKQVRPGLNEHPFTIFKFRTMTNEQGPDGQPLPDKQRITKLGAFLRRTSLDELPELWNVIRGDMSLVGPRALLWEYLPYYNETQRRRHSVKPGITGWAQVNGRNLLSWESKFDYDVWYVDHANLWLDIKILFKTFIQVFRRHGIDHSPQDTMPKFKGSSQEHLFSNPLDK